MVTRNEKKRGPTIEPRPAARERVGLNTRHTLQNTNNGASTDTERQKHRRNNGPTIFDRKECALSGNLVWTTVLLPVDCHARYSTSAAAVEGKAHARLRLSQGKRVVRGWNDELRQELLQRHETNEKYRNMQRAQRDGGERAR